MTRAYTPGWIFPPSAPAADVRTAEKGEPCPACGFITTNSQPDCRCS